MVELLAGLTLLVLFGILVTLRTIARRASDLCVHLGRLREWLEARELT